jgi:hypothetical protein
MHCKIWEIPQIKKLSDFLRFCRRTPVDDDRFRSKHVAFENNNKTVSMWMMVRRNWIEYIKLTEFFPTFWQKLLLPSLGWINLGMMEPLYRYGGGRCVEGRRSDWLPSLTPLAARYKIASDELNYHCPWRSRLQRLPKRLDSSFPSWHNPEIRSKAPIVCRQCVKIRTADISRCECRNWNGQQSFVSKQGLKELENTRQSDRCTAKTQRNGEGKFIGGCLWTWRLENHWSEWEYATEQRKEHSHNRQWKKQR